MAYIKNIQVNETKNGAKYATYQLSEQRTGCSFIPADCEDVRAWLIESLGMPELDPRDVAADLYMELHGNAIINQIPEQFAHHTEAITHIMRRSVATDHKLMVNIKDRMSMAQRYNNPVSSFIDHSSLWWSLTKNAAIRCNVQPQIRALIEAASTQ